MIEDRYFIEPALWSVDEAELRAVRTEVFIDEQSVPEADEWDQWDASADHVLARTRAGQAIGTARLTTDGSIGRIAVLAQWRGQGVAAAMLQHLLDRARARGTLHLRLHAQLPAIPLYRKFGFAEVGAVFLECGIEHQTMELQLQPTDSRPTPTPPTPAASRARRLSCERLLDLREVTLELIGGADHELAIYTRDLEAPLYDEPECIDAIKRVALSGRRAQIRVLLQDPMRVQQEGHRLLDLAQRLPSVVLIRRPTHEDLQYPSAFLLNDNGGYLFRTFGDRFEGEGDACYPPRRDELKRYFDAVWERAEAPPELRRLAL